MLPNGNILLLHFHPYGFTLYIIAYGSDKCHVFSCVVLTPGGRPRDPRGGPAPIYSTSVVPPGRNKFGRGCAKNLPPASFLHAAPVKRKPPGRQNAPAGAFCRNTGVVRSGAAGVDGPVAPAPYSGNRKAWSPHNDCGRGTGWKIALASAPLSARSALLRAGPAVPPALRLSLTVEGFCCRMDPAAVGRGCLSIWPASLSAAAA